MKETPLITDQVVENLRKQILHLQSGVPVRIASERQLATDLSVSRVTLRAALKRLIREGLLIQLQGKGTFITPRRQLDHLHLAFSPDLKDDDPFYVKFLTEMSRFAVEKSFRLSIIRPDNPKAESSGAPLIVIGLFEKPALDFLKTVYPAMVAVQDYPGFEGITQIYFDDYGIGSQAATVLFESGHRNILLLAGPDKYPSAFFRKKGFMETIKKFGLVPGAVRMIEQKMNWNGGYQAAEQFMHDYEGNENPNRPTAVFAANDWLALGFIQKLKEDGMKVPEYVSVIGCDDIPLASEVSPRLTTFNLDIRRLLTEVFSHFDAFSLQESTHPKKILLPASLIMRDTLIKLNERGMHNG